MAAPTTPTPPSTPGREWATQATDTVESVVLAVKEKTTVPLTTAARGVVYGLVIAVLGITCLIALAIASVRLLTVYLPVGRVNHGNHRVWVPDIGMGIIFSAVGFWCWTKRRAK